MKVREVYAAGLRSHKTLKAFILEFDHHILVTLTNVIPITIVVNVCVLTFCGAAEISNKAMHVAADSSSHVSYIPSKANVHPWTPSYAQPLSN